MIGIVSEGPRALAVEVEGRRTFDPSFRMPYLAWSQDLDWRVRRLQIWQNLKF